MKSRINCRSARRSDILTNYKALTKPEILTLKGFRARKKGRESFLSPLRPFYPYEGIQGREKGSGEKRGQARKGVRNRTRKGPRKKRQPPFLPPLRPLYSDEGVQRDQRFGALSSQSEVGTGKGPELSVTAWEGTTFFGEMGARPKPLSFGEVALTAGVRGSFSGIHWTTHGLGTKIGTVGCTSHNRR
jgi:hypothetical protein